MKNNALILLLLVAVIGLFAACSMARSPVTNLDHSSSEYNPSSNVLFSDIGEGKLGTGQSLIYRDYYLVMQEDCNLVVYSQMLYPIWATGTYGKGKDCYLILQSDGELILYGQVWYYFSLKPAVLWRSYIKSTEGKYALVLKYDGNIHVYGPILWSTATNSTASITTHTKLAGDVFPQPAIIDSTFWTNDNAPIGTIIENTDYKLVLQENCNLTLSKSSTSDVSWYTDTDDFLRDCFVNLEANGELRIKYLGGVVLWGSGVTGPPDSNYVLTIRPEGILVVYGPSIWNSITYYGVGSSVEESYEKEKIAAVTEE